MVEFDVDMAALDEADELDGVVLHDENGEYEDMVFYPDKYGNNLAGVFVRPNPQTGN